MTAASLFFLSLILFIAARIGSHSHALGYAFLAACIFGPFVWRLLFTILRDAVFAFVIGFFGGEGLKLSSLFSRPKSILKSSPPLVRPARPTDRRGVFDPSPSNSNLDPLDWRLRK
jgi:hypothetical protein